MKKEDKKQKINEYFDTSRNRFKDNEKDQLFEYVSDDRNTGESKTIRNSYTGWSSDGKYKREEETTYTINNDKSIQVDYSYKDDDGQKGSSSNSVTNPREVLNILNKFFK